MNGGVPKESLSSPKLLNFRTEIKPEELDSIPEEQLPFSSLVKSLDKGDKPCFQPLEMPDPEGVGLEGYREKTKKQIQDMLESFNLVALIGPSRSGKTEGVLAGNSPYLTGLCANPEIEYLAMQRIRSVDEFERYFRYARLEDKKIVLLDEFTPDDLSAQFVDFLIEKGKKVVIAQGGLRSNDAKRSLLEDLAGEHSSFQAIPTIEIGVKPLNSIQLEEVFKIAVQEKQKEGQLPEERLEKARVNWGNIQMANIPLPYHLAVKLAERILDEEGYSCQSRDKEFPSMQVHPPENWKEALIVELQSQDFGSIYPLDQLKEDLGMN